MTTRHLPGLAQIADYDAAFDRSFSLLAFQMNRHIVDHMLRAGRQFVEADFEALLIWGVLAHQNVAHLLPPGSHPCGVLNEQGRVVRPEGLQPLRLRDVAQITGIPRETARRKLEKLAEQGWVARQGDGWVVTRHRVDPDMRDFSREQVRRFLATAEDMLRVLRQMDEQLAREGVTARTSTGLPAASASGAATAPSHRPPPAPAGCPVLAG